MRPWMHAEEEALRILGPVLGGRGCAEAFARSHSAVKQKAGELGVSLRRQKSPQTDFRLSCGPAVLRRISELTQANLCPACGKRPIGVRKTGLCGRCHLEGLRLVHDEAIAMADAQLELWAARSKLLRRRRKLRSVTQDSNSTEPDDEA